MDSITQFLQDINSMKESLGLDKIEKKLFSNVEQEQEEAKANVYEIEKALLNEDKKIKDDAVNKLFLLNSKLILFFSKPYFGKGYAAEDIIANGSLGLVEGLKRFDVTKGYQLSTYVGWYIKKYILKYIEENDLIKVPSYMNGNYIKYLRAKEELSIETGAAEPNDVDIAAKLGVTLDELDKIKNCKNAILSLDEPLTEDGSTLEEITPDRSGENIEKLMLNTELEKTLNLIIEDFLPLEKEVIEYRFGLNDKPVMTLDLLGEKLKLSSERIRQLENSALRKLRDKNRKKLLEKYHQELV